jgi:NAD(P)-dependent dehydrogenase (short-subunit alcohol dehydrogenase family)
VVVAQGSQVQGSQVQGSQVALITGAAGGIGQAMARRLKQHGYHVVVADLDGDAARRTADEVGGTAMAVDVRDFDANHRMVADVLSVFGRLDLAALHAGVNSGQRGADPLSFELYRRSVAVNMDGVVFGIDAVRPALAVQGGAIVVTASLACLAPEVSNPVYTAAKSAVLGYVRAMAAPLAEQGITINALCPGFVDTAMLGPGRSILVEQGFPLIQPDDVAAALLAVVDGEVTGQAWALVAGQPPTVYEFPPIPQTLTPDGRPAPELRVTAAPAQADAGQAQGESS